MKRTRHYLFSCQLLAVLALVGSLAAPPVGAEEIALSYHVMAVRVHGDQSHVRVDLTLLNATAGDLKNVNVRADGEAVLAEGVIQFSEIAAGKTRSLPATFILRDDLLTADGLIELRVTFDDAAGEAHELSLVARSQEGAS